jgi:hypothetical protein
VNIVFVVLQRHYGVKYKDSRSRQLLLESTRAGSRDCSLLIDQHAMFYSTTYRYQAMRSNPHSMSQSLPPPYSHLSKPRTAVSRFELAQSCFHSGTSPTSERISTFSNPSPPTSSSCPSIS